MMDLKQIRRNLESLRERISAAAERSGRAPEAVQLVAVTKTVGIEEARILYELGVRDLGENRVQEAQRKMAALADLDIAWHMIGHLQTNKAKKVAGNFALIHSVDSLRLARALNAAGERLGAATEVLIQINVSGEESKSGFAPDDLAEALDAIGEMQSLRVSGLMTMAPFVDDSEEVRPVFSGLRELRDRLKNNVPSNIELRRLSMGMTQDFEVAIEEGADIVRIGTALFRQD